MIYAFFLGLKAQLRSWRTWLMVLLLPAVIFAVDRFLPAQEISAPVQVGVVLPEEGGQDFWEHLSTRSEAVVSFHLTDEYTLQQKVSTGQWDCGLVLAPDFEEKLRDADTDRLITVFISQSSTVYPLVQETAACALLELVAPGLAREYAQDNHIPGDFTHLVPLSPEQQVQISLQTLDGSAMHIDELGRQTASHLLQGCIALLLLIWAIFSAMDLGDWYTTAAVLRMKMLQSPAALLLPRAAAALTPALLSALCGIVLLKAPLLSVPAVLAYLLVLGAMALLLCRWPGGRTALPCLMPFLVVLSLVFSPMVFDVGALIPALAPVCRFLPMSLYLTACGGSLEALGILAGEGVLLLGLFLLSARKH